MPEEIWLMIILIIGWVTEKGKALRDYLKKVVEDEE